MKSLMILPIKKYLDQKIVIMNQPFQPKFYAFSQLYYFVVDFDLMNNSMIFTEITKFIRHIFSSSIGF